MRRAILLACLPLFAACAYEGLAPWEDGIVHDSTYHRMLAQARTGNAESQNAVGFMLYRGEGVARDPVAARLWFERASAQGNDRARRNLAFMNAVEPSLAAAPPFAAKALARPERTMGQAGYERFCSGCHGLEGIAAYENSPSFAFGERLQKPDAVLMRSIVDGVQEMPGWGGKLDVEELRQVLAHVRSLAARYEAGIGTPSSAPPSYVYLFGRMEERRLGIFR